MLLILFSSSELERDEREVDLLVDAFVVLPAVRPMVVVEVLSLLLALAEAAPLLPVVPVVPDELPEEDDKPEVVLPEFLEPEPIEADEPEELVVLPDPVVDDGLLLLF